MSDLNKSLTLSEECHSKIAELHSELLSKESIAELHKILSSNTENPTVVDEILCQMEGVEETMHRVRNLLERIRLWAKDPDGDKEYVPDDDEEEEY